MMAQSGTGPMPLRIDLTAPGLSPMPLSYFSAISPMFRSPRSPQSFPHDLSRRIRRSRNRIDPLFPG